MITAYCNTQPKIEYLPERTKNGDVIRVCEDLQYYICIDGKLHDFVIPKGETSDGASIPSFLWSLLKLYPLSPEIIKGALCHDFICRHPEIKISFTDSNRILKKMAKVSKIKKVLLFTGVQLFGWMHYRKR